MMRVCASVCACVVLATGFAVSAFSETNSAAPKFEAVDVHSSPHITQPIVRGPFYTSGKYELRFATMVDMIRTAYGVDPEKIQGGPSWLEMDRFDVFAKTPANSTAESRKQMLQNVLSDRFALKYHNDNRPMPAFALTAKHPNLKESDGAETGCKFDVQNNPTAPPTPGTPIQLPTIVYTCHNTSMATFAGNMLNIPGAAQYLNNLLVADQTELKGNYDFVLRFTPKVPAAIQTTGENIPFQDALEKQLGLKLETGTVPMPVMVVDSVNEKPTANSPEVAKMFAAEGKLEFEVASLKPTPPDANTRGGARPDIKNGRLYVPGISLKNLIQVAWDVNSDELMANAPKWLDDDKYDILAKAPEGVAIGDLNPTRGVIPVNIDALRPMLRNLIIERFKMESHMENRPVNAYTLVATKQPKMKKADPTSRTRWQEGVAQDAKPSKNANASLGRLVTCQNVSMAQFAEMLPTIAPGYLRTDVVDSTGLEGGYDFTFSFSPIGIVNQFKRPNSAGSGDGAAGANEAADPSGALTLFDALNIQLGLKLETVKRPTAVLVIDHIERKPIEN